MTTYSRIFAAELADIWQGAVGFLTMASRIFDDQMSEVQRHNHKFLLHNWMTFDDGVIGSSTGIGMSLNIWHSTTDDKRKCISQITNRALSNFRHGSRRILGSISVVWELHILHTTTYPSTNFIWCKYKYSHRELMFYIILIN